VEGLNQEGCLLSIRTTFSFWGAQCCSSTNCMDIRRFCTVLETIHQTSRCCSIPTPLTLNRLDESLEDQCEIKEARDEYVLIMFLKQLKQRQLQTPPGKKSESKLGLSEEVSERTKPEPISALSSPSIKLCSNRQDTIYAVEFRIMFLVQIAVVFLQHNRPASSIAK
jgi:hypothetical protein